MATFAGILATVIWYFVAEWMSRSRSDYMYEIRTVAIVVIVVSVILCVVAYSEFADNNIIGIYLILVANIISNILLIRKTDKGKKAFSIKSIVDKNVWLIGILLMAVVLSYDRGIFTPKWDGLLYFDAVKNSSLDT